MVTVSDSTKLQNAISFIFDFHLRHKPSLFPPHAPLPKLLFQAHIASRQLPRLSASLHQSVMHGRGSGVGTSIGLGREAKNMALTCHVQCLRR